MSIQTLKLEIKSSGNEYKVECTARCKLFILDEIITEIVRPYVERAIHKIFLDIKQNLL